MLTANELRQKYLEFFKSKGHSIIPSASLIPENDPSSLFTTAGMQPLVPFLMGEKHPAGNRIVDVQKCIRTSDIDEVGDATHHTFFEMLGNWSLGDYFKEDSIKMSWEFLTSAKGLRLDANRIAVSVFKGNDNSPFDEEAYNVWVNLGIPKEKIAKLPKENNWWGMETGPCGPDTEIFYWAGNPSQVPESFNDDNELWVEIWNNVFMQYNKIAAGEYEPLKQRNVDTGMGIERILSAVNGFDDNYETELFKPLINLIEELSGQEYSKNQKSFRIIADHLKAATMILGDEKGIMPANVGAGYVLRRLIRRAVRYAKLIGINQIFTFKIAELVIVMYQDIYPEIKKNKEFVINQLILEEEKFNKTIEQGLKELEKMSAKKKISGQDAFVLFSTYGFPLEMTKEIAKEKGYEIDEEEFKIEFTKHQDLSRTASAGMFKGGLADNSEQTTKLHTAAHLMLAALRQVLGPDVYQKGSNITADRLRFDFSYGQKMTPEQLKKVEDIVNEQISKKIPVISQEIDFEEAKKQGAMGVFEHKYGDKVKVYTIGDFSKEICGGPHVDNIEVLGHFKIQKEESSSAGVRRIKAILE
ncbi:MAG: alanine--tRNA ligase [Candidatus Parcubacteria bacterium]|nr:alanine--tRNA ligase [Candidatus Parcubacteria bacterium]